MGAASIALRYRKEQMHEAFDLGVVRDSEFKRLMMQTVCRTLRRVAEIRQPPTGEHQPVTRRNRQELRCRTTRTSLLPRGRLRRWHQDQRLRCTSRQAA